MPTKLLTIVKGKGTKAETRTTTSIKLYWVEWPGRWVSVPEE